MQRTQVQFTEAQLEALKAQAAEGDVSVSEVVRRAVDAWLGRSGAPDPDDLRSRALAAAGRFASGQADIAQQHDRYLSEAHRS
jgi:Arc/MetJ-type ribon-helix-helix transcriptional regulator